MATKSNQTGFDNQYFLGFPMSLSGDWSRSKEWSLSSSLSLSTMLDMSSHLISKEDWLVSPKFQSKQSTLDMFAKEWCSKNPSSTTSTATSGHFALSTKEQKGQSTTNNKPKSKQSGTTDWMAMYNKALDRVSAPIISTSVPIAPSNTPALENPKPKRRPKVIEKVYVDEYTDLDVLFGRGSLSNRHYGNKLYRAQVTENQSIYRSCETKKEKTVIAQHVVHHVNQNLKGKFLDLDKTCNRWYVVPNNIARTKVGQALRDDNTKEARAAKRERYGC